MTLLHHQIRGNGKPVVLIHGLFGSLDNLGMVAKPLSDNYQVISVDVRNHGSSFHEESMTYDELAADVISLLDHLNIKQADFLGHSMGGKIAMQIALNHPEKVNRLIVADIAPVLYPAHHQKIIEGLLSLDLASISSRKAADEQLSHYVDEIGVRQFLLRNLKTEQGKLSFKCNVNFIANCYTQIMQAFDKNKRFDGQVLFIKGGSSNYITSEHRDIIVNHFPNSSAKVIAGAGHWLHAEKTVAFNKIVKDFLAR
ncbi:alpha/beta fold hydrolase [Thalassotalea sp. M1531]|uniref:Alpha/beta fold hydrolase n=1 Tax=Thalassotalea algicola TaxID=2716224 RepID=A0A7Y0Q758_9GAMM|nr:alpha/beta fold hydrolase [Thalassotalea algicola]NMP32689.1 alpha/beta fold hydrolase [Thalassotalea algicola]